MSKLSAGQKREILSKVPLFSALSGPDIEAVAGLATTRVIARREQLFHKGEEGAQLYVVASGRLKVVTTSDEGDDIIFCLVGPGDVLGEIALLCEQPRSATVVAVEASELIVIHRREFLPLLRSRPEVAVRLLSVLAERLVHVSEFVEHTHFLNLPVRLAKKIVDVGNQHGRLRRGERGDELAIELKLSQEEWGDLVGTTRESVNKQFGAWTKAGLIRSENGRIVVTDLDELEKLADCVVI